MGILKCSPSVLKAWRACQLPKEMWPTEIHRALRKSLPAEDLSNRPYAAHLSDPCSPAKQKLTSSLCIGGVCFVFHSFPCFRISTVIAKGKEIRAAEGENGRGGDTEGSLCSGLRLSHRTCSQNEEAIETMFFFRSIDMVYLHRERRNLPIGRITPLKTLTSKCAKL